MPIIEGERPSGGLVALETHSTVLTMSLSAGSQIGPYKIVGQIGSGGMGEVYRATDTKLGRDVAIKTLPTALAQEPDRLARFEREAKLLATLNHAHIGAIYGLDEHDGTRFIAMELIDGQTLEETLKRGALPVEDALRIALQIAEALEAAHEKGVIHRDLKPANIMVTGDGVVKVLDFGLAKAFLGDPNAASPAHSPALSLAMTQQGLILGTAGYMSPEQASGQATDQRADIWAFGVVLYEMLTGLPLFSGESVPHVLAAVLQTEPDWNRLPKNLHPRLKLLLERCLRKRIRDRYHSIADARADIEDILRDPGGIATTVHASVQPTQSIWRRAIPAFGTGVVAILAGIAVGVSWPEAETPLPFVERFDYDLPEGQAIRTLAGRQFLALSPDGRHFVYNTARGLFVRSMSDLEARLIPGTEGPLTSPVFSPDGEWVAYWDGQLKRISIGGGAGAVVAGAVGNPLGLSWETDGTLLFGQGDGIYRVSANGGTPELIIPAQDGRVPFSPKLLPDGDSILFSMAQPGALSTAQIVVVTLSTGQRKVLVEGASEAHYVSTGHLIYSIRDGLFGVVFDIDTLTVSGGAVPLLQGVTRVGETGFANFAVSEDGRLVYAVGTAALESRTLVWVDREGRESPIAAPPRAYTSPRISPDGSKVALNARDQEQDIWIWDFARETFSRLTFDPGQDRFPVWSPDGSRIAYSAQERAPGEALSTSLDWRAADGTGTPERLAEGSGQLFPNSFLPDGAAILLYGANTDSANNSNDDIAIYRMGGEGGTTPLLDSQFGETMPEVSPDGRWMAYVSDESGQEEVYVRPFPDINAGRWQVSRGGGTEPLWARDGSELFYRVEDALFAVPLQTASSFEAGNPALVFEGEQFYGRLQGGRAYDVSPDGERFLMMKQAEDPSARTQFVIVLNWFTEIQRLLPNAD